LSKVPFLDRKISLRFVVLIVLIGLLGTIAFGNIAIHAFKGGKKAGVVGDAVLTMSTIPDLIKRANNADSYLRIPNDRHNFKAGGFTFNYAAGTRPDADYLALSRYDGDAGRGVVEIWDLNTQKMEFAWTVPVDEINERSNLNSYNLVLKRDRTESRTVIRHPYIFDDGTLIFKARTPLAGVGPCRDIRFINDKTLFHHAVEVDEEGYLWIPTRREPTKVPYVDRERFIDDSITRITRDGEIVFQRSVAELLLKNGLQRYVYGRDAIDDNPIHLNDIQPVMSDGKYWKKGDVLLSLRNNSILMLYRPSTDEILWYKEGPWQHQHDVDVLDDHRISVFDNNMLKTWPFDRTLTHSRVLVYDFDTDSVVSPWEDVLAELDFHSETEGLHTIKPDGSIMLEEQNSGRVLMLNPDKKIDWEYVNMSKSGDMWRTAWSRLISREHGDKIMQAVKASGCGG